MIGVIINTGSVVIGSIFGMLFKRSISDRLSSALITSIGLCIICIGVAGILDGKNTVLLIITMTCGTAIGTWIDIDNWLYLFGLSIEKRVSSKANSPSVAQGFVAGSLLMGVGAMGIVGALNAGISGDISTLLTKAGLDFISSILLAINLGIGVMFSALFLLIYEGGVVLLASILSPFLSSYVIAETTCVGSVLILALGLNLIGVTKIKVANLLPAIILAPLFAIFLR